MTSRRRTWQTPSACHMATHCGHIMRANGKAKCWKQTTTWATSQRQILGKGRILVFDDVGSYWFQNCFSKSGIAGCLRKDRQSGGEQNLDLLVEANMFRRLLDDHWEGFSLICKCVYIYCIYIYMHINAAACKINEGAACILLLQTSISMLFIQAVIHGLHILISAHILSQISSGPDLASGAKPMDQWFQWRSDAWLEMWGSVPCYIRYTSRSCQSTGWSDVMFLHELPMQL